MVWSKNIAKDLPHKVFKSGCFDKKSHFCKIVGFLTKSRKPWLRPYLVCPENCLLATRFCKLVVRGMTMTWSENVPVEVANGFHDIIFEQFSLAFNNFFFFFVAWDVRCCFCGFFWDQSLFAG